ncbi:hydantoinase/carbamoylase family amidase [Rhizobium sp. CC-YZS058]|uniref:hydantoinase/carbamoylase family amidase n=1 Tax=Rhizobium sp. CC-YZS058 TaxID=3042153 RepID=UPI002B0605DE|nr:hydantoinase/carbamoylase family amidase [Rhizobium sp. CC-YZS058]MEA3536673.1 hydantoinase/carbamoylase family amidase [Rhizobium sp. CC-YZS058]
MSRPAAVDGARLLRSLADFAAIGATPAGGVNRQALSIEDRRARRLLAERAWGRGFSVFQDEAANLFIRREGVHVDLPPLLIGSHLDSQPTGGRFDGALGTLSAFEVLEALDDAGVSTARPVEVVAFTNEEGSRYAPGCMGSMAFAGVHAVSAWHEVMAPDGTRLEEDLAATLKALPEAVMRHARPDILAFIELHIEQGPVLERETVPIGAVTAVQGTKWLEVTFTGQAAHAGTTPREFRKDAMAAAANAIAELQATVMAADPQSRLTVGRLTLQPGSVNVIPEQVTFTIDLRHPDGAALAVLEALVRKTCAIAGERWGCTAAIGLLLDMASGVFDSTLVDAIETACRSRKIACRRMTSGAFHDALFVNRIAPSAMLFVPCRNGVSHNEAEFVEDRHVLLGAEALLELTLNLAGRRTASEN